MSYKGKDARVARKGTSEHSKLTCESMELLNMKTIPQNASKTMDATCNTKITAATPALSRTPKMVSSAKTAKTVMVAGIA